MKLIYLDPGHGGIDPGAVSGSRHESDDVLRLSNKLKKILEDQGQKVMTCRTTDASVTLVQRTTEANAAKADAFISIHRNAFTNSSANGVEVWVYSYPTSADLGLASDILENLDDIGIQSNRGVKKGNYHVLRESNMTSCMIELGYMTNVKDNEYFDHFIDAYAEAIAQGIMSALGEQWEEPDNTVLNPDPPLYRVQIGAFSVKANAESFLQTVRSMGLQAYIVAPAEAKDESLQ